MKTSRPLWVQVQSAAYDSVLYVAIQLGDDKQSRGGQTAHSAVVAVLVPIDYSCIEAYVHCAMTLILLKLDSTSIPIYCVHK